MIPDREECIASSAQWVILLTGVDQLASSVHERIHYSVTFYGYYSH